MSASEPLLLIVDDEVFNLEILEYHLLGLGCQVELAVSVSDALERIEASSRPFDLALIDRIMPGGDGLNLLRSLRSRADWKGVPLILQTAVIDSASIAEGLDAGAFYYLTKPFEPEVLCAVVRSALQERQRHLDLTDRITREAIVFSLLTEGSLTYRTLDEAHAVAGALANLHPDPNRVGPGLLELTVNAVEHGNLGIGYQLKSQLLREQRLASELDRRLALPEYRNRVVTVQFDRKPTAVTWTICDQGNGFDPTPYLSFDSGRAFDLNGRGIAMATSASLDDLRFVGRGNELIATATINPDRPGAGG